MYIKIRAATGVPGPLRLHEEFQELMAVANMNISQSAKGKRSQEKWGKKERIRDLGRLAR